MGVAGSSRVGGGYYINIKFQSLDLIFNDRLERSGKKSSFKEVFIFLSNSERNHIHRRIVSFIMADGTETLTSSLEEAEGAVAFAINNGAAMIYFHHSTQSFMYFIGSDDEKYREEMRHLKTAIRQGRISAITAGEPINIEGTNIFPMDVRMKNAPCYPYMMLRRRGRFEDADYTPYFFKSKQKRDRLVAYFMDEFQTQG